MVSKKGLLFLAAIVILVVAGVLFNRVISVEKNIGDAISDVKYYKFKTNLSVSTVGIVNGSYVNMTIFIGGGGEANLVKKKMYMPFRVNISGVSGGRQIQASNDMVMYVIGDILYMNSGGQWFKQKIPEPDLIWNNQTHVAQQKRLIEDAELELIREEDVGGVSSRLFKVKPSPTKLLEYIAQSGGGNVPDLMEKNMDDLAEMVKDINILMWISKDGSLPLKSLVNIKTGGENMTTELTVDVVLYDYDKPVDVTLPGDALKAAYVFG